MAHRACPWWTGRIVAQWSWMLDNLPSASGRKPLASGRAVTFAVLVHVAAGAVIYASTASTGGASPGEESGRPAAPLAVEPQPSRSAAPARDAARGETAALPDASRSKSAGQPPIGSGAADASTGGERGPDAPVLPSGPSGTNPGAPPSSGGLGSSVTGAPAGSSESPLLADNGLSLREVAGGAAPSYGAGGIAIDAPDTMRLGERYEVRIVLPPPPVSAQSSRAADDTAAARPPRNGISPVRQAVLAGENLLVEPRTAAMQLADSAAASLWSWMVTPTKPGRSRLAAEISVVHYRDGAERIARLRPAQKEVHVSASTVQKISRFFAAQWLWIGVLLLIAVAWRRGRGRGGPAATAAVSRRETHPGTRQSLR